MNLNVFVPTIQVPNFISMFPPGAKSNSDQDPIIGWGGSCRGTFQAADMDPLRILNLLLGNKPIGQCRLSTWLQG